MSRLFIYILGLLPLAFGYQWARANLPDFLTLALVVAYLIGLRFLSERCGK